jgi:hypothetical protein
MGEPFGLVVVNGYYFYVRWGIAAVVLRSRKVIPISS